MKHKGIILDSYSGTCLNLLRQIQAFDIVLNIPWLLNRVQPILVAKDAGASKMNDVEVFV